MNKQRYKKYKSVTESYDEQAKTMSKVKRAIDNFAGQVTVDSDLEKDVGEFLLKKGISFMKDDSNLSKGKITFKLGYKKLKESYPINAFSDAQSKTYDRLNSILSKFKSLNRKYVPRKSIDGTDKVMLSKSGKDFVNIYKDGSFEILDENGKVTAKVKDINDFSDNDLGVIFKKELNIEESLKESLVDDKNIIIDAVQGIFETGHGYIEDKQEMEETVDHKLTPSSYSRLYDFYQNLLDLGPAGFYEEYKDKLNFSADFVAEYGYEEDEEDLRESLLKIGLFS